MSKDPPQNDIFWSMESLVMMLENLRKVSEGDPVDQVFVSTDMAALKIIENLIKQLNDTKKK
jgi:hypothetical protein